MNARLRKFVHRDRSNRGWPMAQDSRGCGSCAEFVLCSDCLSATPASDSGNSAKAQKTAMTKQRMPEGWDAEQIAALARHYDNQSAAEELAELEAAWERGYSTVQIPEETCACRPRADRAYESLRA